ncbi:hypothetical protein PROFUN_03787 [Planoprotostelium fungivorum]|uniref:Ubiquitin-like domain-containing protein n=1 Tax=Planoprotostelium fungivorum TaxID=1890364 RepID=A0A2P6NDR5_9EUKA|nr:hypothetical protein PROFUN_03787 [Planoprotostelium fungivorum]
MIVFFNIAAQKGQTVTLDLDADTTIVELRKKIAERLNVHPEANRFVFAGKTLEKGKLADYGITNECTVHVNAIPPLKLTITYGAETVGIDVPRRSDVTARDIKRIVRDAFPDEPEFGRCLPDLYRGKTKLRNNIKAESLKLTDGENLAAQKGTPEETAVVNHGTQHFQDQIVDRDELIASFDASKGVEVAFSFDTTGSMADCLQKVRAKITETAEKLLKDIKDIKIAIIAHGDYVDNLKAIQVLDLTNNVRKIKKFVDGAGTTYGDDAPEAYELALREANHLSWTKEKSKALVMIGDEVPHPPSFTTESIDWYEETDKLREKGVKVYGVRALNCSHAVPFYEEISERTGGLPIRFESFDMIVEMFMAICYREAGMDKLEQYKQQVMSDNKTTSADMAAMFSSLERPNVEIKLKEEEKEEKEPRVRAPWYDYSLDVGTPYYERKDKGWRSIASGIPPASTITSTAEMYRSGHCTMSAPFTAEAIYKLVIVGDGAVGKTSLLLSYCTGTFPEEYVPTVFDNYASEIAVDDGETIGLSFWDTAGQEDYDRLRPLSYPGTDIFVVCFNVTSPSSFDNVLHKWLPEIRHHCPTVPFVLLGLKSDLRNDGATLERLKGKGISMIAREQAVALAKTEKAIGYHEISARTGENMKEFFLSVGNHLHQWRKGGMKREKSKGKGCNVI